MKPKIHEFYFQLNVFALKTANQQRSLVIFYNPKHFVSMHFGASLELHKEIIYAICYQSHLGYLKTPQTRF